MSAQYVNEAVEEIKEERERAFKSAIKAKVVQVIDTQKRLAAILVELEQHKTQLRSMKLEDLDTSFLA